MLTLKGEARGVTSNKREYDGNEWTEYNLKVETENGDYVLRLTKSQVEKNLQDNLAKYKGKNVEVEVSLSCSVSKAGKLYKTWYMNSEPKEIKTAAI